MPKNNYNRSMARDIFHKVPEQEKHSGEDIHSVINGVHLDYERAKKDRSEIEKTISFRDLLSFLIKTYGH